VDDRVKQLLKDLGEAISEAVSDSVRVESILQAIRDSGYEARLMLEAIIAVQSNGEVTQETLLGQDDEPDSEIFTAEDRRFLKLLKIDY
jgi:hypothetical protein